MTGGLGSGDRPWSADERAAGAGPRDHDASARDADARDADARDAAADARDAAADERDRLTDAWETDLEAREARLRADRHHGGEDGEDADQAHAGARARREQARRDRDTAATVRTQAAERLRGLIGVAQVVLAGADPGAGAGKAGGGKPGGAADGQDDGDEDERAWSADRRDFVADQRDYLADARDSAADERDRLADAREAELDEWEARLDARRAADDPQEQRAAEERERARARRGDARRGRESQRADREAASAARSEAARRRRAGAPATGLARAFAEIARHLYAAENLDDVLSRIVDVSVSAVPGCEMASITVRQDDGDFVTVASTHQTATAVDQAQYEAGEGPSLSAVDEAVVHAEKFPDPRWQALGSRPADAGVHSAVSYSLAPSGPPDDALLNGSLNAYAGRPGAFDDEAREIGLILSAHASIAVRAVGERDALEQLGQQLHDALASRDVIGQAKGILMERLRITPEDAFDTLRRSSQRLNVKLREIAQKLAETGELDDAGRG